MMIRKLLENIQMVKECWSCDKFKAYYTKGQLRFDKQNCGYCTEHEVIIKDKHKVCDYWVSNEIRRLVRNRVVLKSLTQLIDNLIELKQIIADEQEENKINPL